MKLRLSRNQKVIAALGLSSLVSVVLFFVRSQHYDTWRYWFLNWNLLLAWLPLLFAWQLHLHLKKHRWPEWQPLTLTALWLVFLPNSFYLSSDLIHLQKTTASNILYDTALFLSFAINGILLGFISLYLVHLELLKRVRARTTHLLISLILLAGSFAIYLGRNLRWSSWDVLINPDGILFDLSDRIINPSSHPTTFVTTLTFFALLGSTYFVLWQITIALKSNGKN